MQVSIFICFGVTMNRQKVFFRHKIVQTFFEGVKVEWNLLWKVTLRGKDDPGMKEKSILYIRQKMYTQCNPLGRKKDNVGKYS